MPERIDIQPFDLANEKLTDVKHMYIELGENYFLYTAKYYGQEPKAEDHSDHSMGWKDKKADFYIKIKRDSIVAIDLQWVESHTYWNIEIEINGYPVTLRIYFQTKKEAQPIFDKLDEFIFGKKTELISEKRNENSEPTNY